MQQEILLIEDNEGDIYLIKEAFRDADFMGRITEIRDGEAAIKFFLQPKAHEADFFTGLILLDVNLPKKNGHEVLKFIKTTPHLKHIPVVIFTTSSAKSDISKAYRNAVNSFITKPTDTEDFLEVIAKIKNYWFPMAQLSE